MLCLAPLSTSTWAVTAVVRKQSAHCSEANSSVCTAGAALAQGEGHPTTDQLHHCAPREHCSTCRQPSHLHIDLSCYLVSVFLPRKLMAAILRALHCLSEHLKAFSLSRSGEGLHCTCQSRGGMLYAWLCQLFLPPFQYAAGQDVFLYWNNNGCDPGRLCSPNKARKWNQSCKKGKYICQYFLSFPPTNLMHPFSV